jgi:general secretion pathway protein D
VSRGSGTKLESKTMRRGILIFVSGLLSATLSLPLLASADDSPASAPTTCRSGVPGGVNCVVSKQDKKEARAAYERGLKLQNQHQLEEAFDQFDQAAKLVPQDGHFLTARELVKAQLVSGHLQRGNTLLAENSRQPAASEFRAALDLDPDNEFALQQLDESLRLPATRFQRPIPSRLVNAGEIHLEPGNERATFHFSGDVRDLYTQLGSAYGIKVEFDDSVKPLQLRFNVDDLDFFTAVKLAGEVSKTMWAPLEAHEMLVAYDNQENHKQFDRMSLGTFTLPPHASAQDATELVNTMRTLFDLRFITSAQSTDTVEVRAPQPILAACAKLLDQLSNTRPQVMLDISVFQISHQFTRTIGIHVPQTFNLYNIPVAALAGLAGGSNIQQLINQLISSGGINQAGSTALSGLLAQLGGGGSGIFSSPLATFGGGLTFSGLSLDQLTTALSVNESWARSLQHVTIRATQGNDSVFKVGERYPIQNASYAPIYNSPQIAQVLGNQSYVPPFPSISYEDLGLNVKAKPTIHGDGSVNLQLEMQVRSLTGASSNGVPVIANREFNGGMTLKDGESAVIAGEMDRTDQVAITGLPLLGSVPLLKYLGATNTKEEDDDELMIVITPHIVSDVNRSTPEIWISAN